MDRSSQAAPEHGYGADEGYVLPQIEEDHPVDGRAYDDGQGYAEWYGQNGPGQQNNRYSATAPTTHTAATTTAGAGAGIGEAFLASDPFAGSADGHSMATKSYRSNSGGLTTQTSQSQSHRRTASGKSRTTSYTGTFGPSTGGHQSYIAQVDDTRISGVDAYYDDYFGTPDANAVASDAESAVFGRSSIDPGGLDGGAVRPVSGTGAGSDPRLDPNEEALKARRAAFAQSGAVHSFASGNSLQDHRDYSRKITG